MGNFETFSNKLEVLMFEIKGHSGRNRSKKACRRDNNNATTLRSLQSFLLDVSHCEMGRNTKLNFYPTTSFLNAKELSMCFTFLSNVPRKLIMVDYVKFTFNCLLKVE